MVHVVLSGGSGKRLWPLSRSKFPKQFLKLYHHRSLFQLALERLDDGQARFLVVCNQDHYFHALEEIAHAKLEARTQFLLETAPKNTMNALILAALACAPDEVLLISPTDHLMDTCALQNALKQALPLAQQGKMVLFGVAHPPSSEYGLIACTPSGQIMGFIEKPSLEQIAQLNTQKDRKFFINSGMFVFQAQAFLQECATHTPEMLKACQEVYKHAKRLTNILKCEGMETLVEGSVDVCLWQRCAHLALVPFKGEWRDVGHFLSLKESLHADTNGNVCHQGMLETQQATNNYVYSAPDKLVCLLGLQECVVVDTKDALLIAPHSHLDMLKSFLEQVQHSHPAFLQTCPIEYRPWGSFEVLLEHTSFKVKLLNIAPHKRLSLQRHQQRSEHWVVVEGIASVVLEDQTLQVHANESVFIKQGQLHRLGNATDAPLKILEVQCGVCDEDDIERLEDDYKRP
ncbi:sugar phosphate nucleotidyltransferase [Helicobacter baculiformis]|uniref:Sugar phosphate nucleotidyltransferase n=1 Tax=Helicobacter baculiformis TaxID=427351 RepID=A0ABV7ZIB6_9HELI|nr:sugar phosphate nucleotidyltransferase [Helicobacter baculiformis]